jgi:hypothetical protein
MQHRASPPKFTLPKWMVLSLSTYKPSATRRADKGIESKGLII